MTINVSGPNGVNVSFPDGTDAATINSVMAQHFGGSVPKAPAPGRPWEAYGHVSGPWDEWRSDPVAPKSTDTAGDWLNKKYTQAGFDVKPNRTSHIAPTSEELTTNLENNLTGPLYQPQTVPGQHLRTAIGFAPQALGAAETGGAAAVPALVKIGKKLIFSPRVWGSWAPGMLQAAMRPDAGV